MQDITSKVAEVVQALIAKGQPEPGKIIVLGTSTSEVIGSKIGTSSSEKVAQAIWDGMMLALDGTGLYLAVQCCEHLNRALVVEAECFKAYNLEEVHVVPALKAGGAMATHAFKNFQKPIMVENISAHYGIDIGQTMIGMHLKPVAVPVRSTYNKIGEAQLTMAYSRPKLIGGERACYTFSK